MRGSLLTLVVVASAWAVPPGVDAPKPKPEPAPRLDRHGDPLPAGALARLGTTRLRLGSHAYALAVSLDGKRVLVADSDRSITAFDAATGRRLPANKARREGNSYTLAFSPDATVLAGGD